MTYIPDIYSGVQEIGTNSTLTIINNRQMINYGGLTIQGTIIIKGDLILK